MYSRVRGSKAILCLAVLVVANVGASVVHLGPGLLERADTKAATQPWSGSAHPLRVRTWATLDDSQEALDAGGIVAFDFGYGIALGQHNHLGGTRNIAARPVGSFVHVSGAGSIDGTYRVAENIRTVDMDEDDLGRIAQGRLVAYTCIGPSDDDVRQVIALERVDSTYRTMPLAGQP
jgi:hypothetical protein